MRQRQRSIPYRIYPTLQAQRRGSISNIDPQFSYFSVDSRLPIPRYSQRFLDQGPERVGPVGAPCFNVKVNYSVGGFFPDFGQADKERVNNYVDYSTDTAEDIISLPTAHVLQRALPLVPEMLAPIDWRWYAAKAGHAEWIREGWSKPRLSLYQDFSAVNFLLEWKQMLGLAKSWFKRDELIARWHKLRRKNVRLDQRAEALANERLAHVYGTKLLIADARFMFESLVRLNEKVARFLKRCKGVQRLYRKGGPKTTTFQPLRRTVPFDEFDGIPGGSLITVRTVEVRSRAVLYYTAHPPKFKWFWTRFAQLCDAYGVRLDAGIAWDAIKFSFVVDWFVNVGPWLHANWSIDNYQIDVKYIAFGNSVRIDVRDELIWRRDVRQPGVPGVSTLESSLLSRDTTIYRRSYGEIPKIGAPVLAANSKPWSINRALNALALVVQGARIPGRALSKRFFSYTDR